MLREPGRFSEQNLSESTLNDRRDQRPVDDCNAPLTESLRAVRTSQYDGNRSAREDGGQSTKKIEREAGNDPVTPGRTATSDFGGSRRGRGR